MTTIIKLMLSFNTFLTMINYLLCTCTNIHQTMNLMEGYLLLIVVNSTNNSIKYGFVHYLSANFHK